MLCYDITHKQHLTSFLLGRSVSRHLRVGNRQLLSGFDRERGALWKAVHARLLHRAKCKLQLML